MLHILGVEKANPEELSVATIVLEPASGGDLKVHDRTTAVEQLKSRSDGGTWSLRDIVEHVLPDLYLASRKAMEDSSFRFITDGRMGRWKQVRDFFESLKDYAAPDNDVLALLANFKELTFQRSSSKRSSKDPFWSDGAYTERRLVERIVEEVRKRKEVKAEDI